MKLDKKTKLFIILGAFFITNALVAEFIGVKLFSLEKVFGFEPLDFTLFGIEHLSFTMTAGVILWPVVFIMTDIINEYYGFKGVRLLSILASIMIAYAFIGVSMGIEVPANEMWKSNYHSAGIEDMQLAYKAVFGQGLWIIIGSLVAFLVGQFIDVYVFHSLRKLSGSKMLWLRSTGSTLVSQLIDSFVVLFIAFYIGAGFSLSWVLAIGLVNYIYKFAVAVLVTPLLYLIHHIIDSYLGEELSHDMIENANQEYEN